MIKKIKVLEISLDKIIYMPKPRIFLVIVLISLIMVMFFYETNNNVTAEKPMLEYRNIKLDFFPFTDNQSLKMRLDGIDSSPIFKMLGKTDDRREGFIAYTRYNGDFISLILGKVNKTSSEKNNPQLTISFEIEGADKIYNIIFINGKVNQLGWVDNNYYEELDANSSKLLNIPALIGPMDDYYKNINKVTVSLERNTIANQIDFDIKLYNNDLPESTSIDIVRLLD